LINKIAPEMMPMSELKSIPPSAEMATYAVGHPVNLRVGVTLLLGGKVRSVGDYHPYVADAGLIDAGVVYLVEYSVA
jgi:hypothetical protein